MPFTAEVTSLPACQAQPRQARDLHTYYDSRLSKQWPVRTVTHIATLSSAHLTSAIRPPDLFRRGTRVAVSRPTPVRVVGMGFPLEWAG